MKKKFFIFSAIYSVFLVSCTTEEITVSNIEQVNISTLSQNGVEADISARIKNPNFFPFTIYKSELDITLGGIKVGTADLTDNVKIKSKSNDVYIFKIKSDFSDLKLSDLPNILALTLSNSATVEVKGNLKVGNFFIKHKIPVDIVQEVPLGTAGTN